MKPEPISVLPANGRTRLRVLPILLTFLLVVAGALVATTGAEAASKTYTVKPSKTVSVPLSSATYANGSATATFSLPALPAKGASAYTSVVLRNGSKGSYSAQLRVYSSGTMQLSIKRLAKSGSQRTITTLVGPAQHASKLTAKKGVLVRLSAAGTKTVTLNAVAQVYGKKIRVTAKDSSSSRISTAGTALAQFTTGGTEASAKTTLMSSSTAPTSVVTPVPTPKPTATPKPAPAPAPEPVVEDKPASTGYPSASNTGVPKGVTLKVHEGDLVVTKANTVIDGLLVKGTVTVQASGVVIKNSKIVGGKTPSSLGLVNNFHTNSSFKVIDSELYAAHPSPMWNGVFGSNFTLERVNIHTVVDPIRVLGSNVTVRDSWLHDTSHWKSDPLRDGTATHDDNIQIQAGGSIVIEGNRIEDAHNAGVQITQDTSRTSLGSVTIRDNYLQGGGCTVNIAKTPKTFPLTIKGNVFGPERKHAKCNVIAPTSNRPSMSGNVWGETGASANVFTPL